MLTQDKSLEQVKVHQSQHGIINPSRDITADDELYLRDYTLAAKVISWDRGTYDTPERVTPAQITNIALTGDIVWYQIDFHQAIPIDIETFHTYRLQIQIDKVEQQPVGFAGDSVSCQLRPNQEFIIEYEQGNAHGRLDAGHGVQPICVKADCAYSAGYLEGYTNYNEAKDKINTPSVPTWSVTYNDKWDWYTVWVDNRAIGRALTYQEAERIAQKYIADRQAWQQHRERVLASYADELK